MDEFVNKEEQEKPKPSPVSIMGYWRTEQKIHSTSQITSPTQLQRGRTYRVLHDRDKEGIDRTIRVTSPPKTDGIRFCAQIIEGIGQGETLSLSLADHGISPYPGGSWNDNYFMVPEQRQDQV